MKSKVVVAGLCALALMFGAASAPAQISGLYYQEIEKDGRVYVFNTPERAKMFEEGGEVGTAITLVGKAEGGKTLVAENETAVDLYLFKHDLPGYDRPTPKPEKKFDERVFYKDGKTNIVMKAGTVAISNRLQARFTQEDREIETAADPNRGTFRIRRMKTAIEGNLANLPWKFKLQANWVGGDVVTNTTQDAVTFKVTQSRSRGPILEDAELWYTKNPMATIWMGQGKGYFGRQELTSSGKQQFVDRSITSERFHAARQIGIGLIGLNQDKTFEYNVGVYNGGGRNAISTTRNDNDDYMKVARVVWSPNGEYKLEESSLDYPATPIWFIGGSWLGDTTGLGTSETDVTRLGAEAGFKLGGWNVVGEWHTEESETVAKPQVDTDGYYVQLGYLFPNKKFELAGRLATILPDTATSTDQTEKGIAFSWYFDKHTHKLQADFREIENDATKTKDKEIRLQAQLIF